MNAETFPRLISRQFNGVEYFYVVYSDREEPLGCDHVLARHRYLLLTGRRATSRRHPHLNKRDRCSTVARGVLSYGATTLNATTLHRQRLVAERVAREKVPATVGGVYFLIDKGEIIYIDQSRDVYRRITRHKQDKQFDSIYIEPVAAKQRLKVEALYINLFQPLFNERIPRRKA